MPDIPVPSYCHLSDLFSKLDVTVKQRRKRLARRLANGEDVMVIIDSTGLNFDGASQWYEEKYGKKAARTPWRKMHLAIDPDMNIHAIEITGTDVALFGRVRISPLRTQLCTQAFEAWESVTCAPMLERLAA
jgi:Transposase DDE domain